MIVTLLDGNTVDSSSIVFDDRSYHFYIGATDITRDLRRVDKLELVPNFDVERDNIRASQEAHGKTLQEYVPLQTNAGVIFVDQITTDPLAAPLESVDSAVKKVLSSTGVKKILIVGIVVLAVVIYFKER
jgi:hypothetical protein